MQQRLARAFMHGQLRQSLAVVLLAPGLQVIRHACSWVLWILVSSERLRRNSRQMKAIGQSRGLAEA